MIDELELLRDANPVALHDVPNAPEGLYDRIARRRRVPTGRILLAAAAAGAVAVAVTVVSSLVADERQGGVVELALAAVSEGPVIHAVVESDVNATLIDLESGETTSEALRSEIWFDQERDQLHGRVTIGESLAFEGTAHAARIDPALAGFASGYRDSLESGEARIVGETTVDGRRAVLLRITLNPGGLAEEVAVDADDYRPLRFRLAPGSDATVGPDAPWFRVVSIESIAHDPADFAPAEGLVLHGGITRNDRQVPVDVAATALGQPALWPGRDVEGVELRAIDLLRVETRWAKAPRTARPQEPVRTTEKPALMLEYGPDLTTETNRWLKLAVGTSAEEIPLVGPLPHQRAPEGKLRLMGFRDNRWFGTMERDGLHLKFESSQRSLILAAAKALRPLG